MVDPARCETRWIFFLRVLFTRQYPFHIGQHVLKRTTTTHRRRLLCKEKPRTRKSIEESTYARKCTRMRENMRHQHTRPKYQYIKEKGTSKDCHIEREQNILKVNISAFGIRKRPE